MTPRARVGISGWRYASWRGDFYSLQRPSSWRRWRDAVPDDVEIAVKGPRFVTHFRRLRDTRTGMANFLASGVLALGPTLGPLIWQTPADLPFEPEVIEPFLAALPRSTAAALDLARGREDRMAGREHLEIDADRPIRHALEPRHPSFDSDAFADLAARYDVAIVLADSAGRWPAIDRATASFAYARLHGDTELYASGYTGTALDRWAEWMRRHLDAGRDAYAFLDNDARGRAPWDAMALKDRVER